MIQIYDQQTISTKIFLYNNEHQIEIQSILNSWMK